MKTIVEFTPSKVRATFKNNGVECGDADLLVEILHAVADPTHALSSPSVPDADYARARLACEALGGTIVAYSGPPRSVPGLVY